jgi:hypothetical protein
MEKWWFRHLCFWIAIVLYYMWGGGLKVPYKSLLTGLGYLPGGMIVVYPFLYILLPKLLYKQKFLLFFISFAALLFCAKYTTEFMVDSTTGIFGAQRSNTGNNILPFIPIAAIAGTAKLVKYYFYRRKKADEEQEERIKTELELLKSQIHPNFLFNTLNNLFAHTMKNSPESPNIVLKLSDLLRFMIYESRCEFIPLDHEILLLKNYIELEKLRHEKDLEVSFVSSGEFENKLIRPLMLLPLVELAFNQASSDEVTQKWISTNIHSEDTKLLFNLTNSKNSRSDSITLNKGIENVRKRLDMLYASDHVLTISDDSDINIISLELVVTDAITLPQNFTLIRNKSYEMEMPVGG